MNNINILDYKIKGEKYFELLEVNKKLNPAFENFKDIYYIFAGASIFLNKAENKNLDIEEYKIYFDSNKNSVRLFLRREYLKHSILSYSSISDYISHIILFAFGLNKEKVINKETYNSETRYKYMNKVLEMIKKKCQNHKGKEKVIYNWLEDYLTKYINGTSFIHYKCNSIKHFQNISINGLDNKNFQINVIKIKKEHEIDCKDRKEYYKKVKQVMEDKNKIEESSDWYKAEINDIDILIENVYKESKVIKIFVEELYNFIVKEFPEYELEIINISK